MTLEFTPNRLYQGGLALGGLLALLLVGCAVLAGRRESAPHRCSGAEARGTAAVRPWAWPWRLPALVAGRSAGRSGVRGGAPAGRPRPTPDRRRRCDRGRAGGGVGGSRRHRREPAVRAATDLVRRAGGRGDRAGGRRAADPVARASRTARTWLSARLGRRGRRVATVALGRRGGRTGADRRSARLAGGAPRPRLLHPGRLLGAHPGRAAPVGGPAGAGLRGSPVPRGDADRLVAHPPRAHGLGGRGGRDRGHAAGRVAPRLGRALPAGAGIMVAAAGPGGLPVLPAGTVADAVVGRGHPVPAGLHLPVPGHLGAAPPDPGGQPMVRSAGGAGHAGGPALPGARRPLPRGARVRGHRLRRSRRSAPRRRGPARPPRGVGAAPAAPRRVRRRASRARAHRPHLARVASRRRPSSSATSSPATPSPGSSGDLDRPRADHDRGPDRAGRWP